MATPHVAGVIALMREANPDLSVKEIKAILMATAHDFGEPGEDNNYGVGFIDAYESVLMAIPTFKPDESEWTLCAPKITTSMMKGITSRRFLVPIAQT